MPRAGQVKPPTDERLSDRVAIGLLTRAFSPAAVDAAVASTDRGEVRNRLLPARVVVYYVLAMCLFSGQGYEEVMRLLVGGLEWMSRWRRALVVPSTAAIAKARTRLGAEPLRALFEATVRPLATDTTRGAWYRGLRLVAMDGATLDVPDTTENDEHFGRPGSSRGDGEPLFAAALWSVWKPVKDAAPLLSCTIITTDSAGPLAEIHDRMPLTISRGDWDRWLDPDAPIDEGLLRGHGDLDRIEIREVSRLVNSVRNNGPELIEPAEPEPEQATLL